MSNFQESKLPLSHTYWDFPGVFHTFSQGYLDPDGLCFCSLHSAEIVSVHQFLTHNIDGFNFIASNYFHLEAVWKESHHWLWQMSFPFFWMVLQQLS